MLAIWTLVPLPLLKSAWTSRSSWFMYYWSLAGRIWGITLLACEMSATVWYFEHSLALPFFGIRAKTDLFQSCGDCWVFQICWHIECSTFTASFSRIRNSSTGIPSPPLALFIVMLPKDHLTSHSKESCLTLCDHMNHNTPGLPVHRQLPEFTQTHVHWVSDAIQPSHPLSSPSPPAPNPSQHQSLFQWVNSSNEVAKVLEFQL